ncbi:MAG TPA: ParB/RepB/Spo0J family partition protein [Candidatus Limnocylindrales bacterium]|nr:ParB/RepB/Spo0J family partition protein [Candidatus Limnocylindrales bacterium]
MRQPLGRGLDAILGGPVNMKDSAESRPGPVPQGEQKGKPLLVHVERVVAGRGQPRRIFADEQLDELAASIRENGILQPLVVKDLGGSYELIAGERRLRAAVRAGLEKVPVVIRETTSDSEMLELALVENLQREDLGPLERARAYERLLQTHGMLQDDIAKKVGKSRTAVTNTLRLLGLPSPVLDAMEQGLITEGHARSLLALPTATRQIEGMQSVVRRALSVRETEQLVREWLEPDDKHPAGASKPADKRSAGPVEMKLSRMLGTKVRFRGGMKKGRIEIEYYSQEELMRLIDLLSSRESG